jgi:DNA-binding NarL/FixJ family response regulator
VSEGPPLLERERELARLESASRSAEHGHGSVLLIAGAAGVGKSALLAAGGAAAGARGVVVRWARGSELEQELPFGVIRQLLEPALARLAPGERAALFHGAAAPAERLFGDVPLDERAAGDGFAILHALFWLVAGLADHPLWLAVDDLQWVDPPSLRALHYLGGRIGELPVLLVSTLRRHDPGASAELVAHLEELPAATTLELSALSAAAAETLVREALPDADARLCRTFAEASAGNPFYLRELLRSVSGRGELPTVEEVRGAAVTAIGDRVRRRLTALANGLAPPLAEAMAVLGASGRLPDAAAVAGLQPGPAAEAALAMRLAEILRTEDPFTWVHPLVQRSILDGLTVVERDRLHGRAAEVLAQAGAAPGRIAAHLAALRPNGSDHVVAGLLAAVEDALGRDAPELGVRLLRRALEEDAAVPGRAALLLRLGQVEVTRRNPAAADALREARALAPDGRTRALAALALAEGLVFDGRWEEATRVTEEALSEVDPADDELALEIELARALICAMDPQLASLFLADRPRLRQLARGGVWPARGLSAALAMISSFNGASREEVVALCDHALADGVLLGERGAGAFSSGHVGMALITVDELDRALALADEVEAAARAQGSVANTIAASLMRGASLLGRGELGAADEFVRPVIELAAGQGMLLLAVTGLWYAVDAIVERPSLGDLGELAESLVLPPSMAEAAGGGWLGYCRGRLLSARGDLAGARAELERVVSIFAALEFGPLHVPSRGALALALPPEERDRARALAAEDLALARRAGLPRACGVALRTVALLAEPAQRIELLRESVAMLAGSPSRYEYARSLLELGAALRRDRRRLESQEPLAAALELGAACGAERLVAHAREELIAAGRRPRRIARTGFGALTASERRVVRLAAAGRSNSEIAQALYLSVKTIETHLTNAYGKLGLSGPGARRQLPTILADHLAAAA